MQTSYIDAYQWIQAQRPEWQTLVEDFKNHQQEPLSFHDIATYNPFLERRMIHALIQLRQSTIDNIDNHYAYAIAQQVAMVTTPHDTMEMPEEIEPIIANNMLIGILIGQQMYIPHHLVWYRIDMYGTSHICEHDYTLQLVYRILCEYEKTTG